MDPQNNERPTSAAPAVSAQMLVALTRPALATFGDVVLDAHQQLWLQGLLDALADVLTRGLNEGETERRIDLEWLTGGLDGDYPDAGFGFVLATRDDSSAALVTLDVPAARALVDLIESQLADVRGAGEITQTEHGLLEFTTLSALDELMGSAEIPPTSLALTRFLSRAELIDGKTFEQFVPLWVRVTVAGREGIATLWLSRASELFAGGWRRLNVRTDRARSVGPGDVEVTVTLPPVTLHAEVFGSMREGDVLMLGATDLSSFGARCRVVSTNAWQLASVVIEGHGPERLTVRCGALTPDVYRPPIAPRGKVAVLPTLGAASLTLDQVRAWCADQTLDLVTPSESPVDLIVDARWVASGELVAVEGEIGVRITEREHRQDASPDRPESGGG